MASKIPCEDSVTMACPNQLDLFLTGLADTKANFPDGENSQIIREELNQIIQGTLLDLSGKYRLFHKAVVQQGGSMVEGTKIGQADEFDYVFILTELQEQLVWKDGKPFCADNYDMNIQSTKLVLNMKELCFMEDILCPDWCDQEENEQRRSNQLIFKDGKSPWRDEISAMVSEAIHRSLQSQVKKFTMWQHVARLKYPSGRTYLQILKFTDAEGSERFVSVDICFAIQIPHSAPNSEPLQLLFDFWSINTISCSRRSESTWELSKLSSLPLDSVEKRCYRVLKYLIQTFLESQLDLYTMEYKAVIGTYTLKTLFLNVLMESEEKWELHQLGQKTLEILELIRKDLETLKSEKTSSDLPMQHPLLVSMEYSLHPQSAEPALFQRSNLLNPRKSFSKPVFKQPEAIEDQVFTLIELLLMVRDTDEGREHILSQIEAIERLKIPLKDGTYQVPVMEKLVEKDSKRGVYNNFLLIWHIMEREDFKNFMRRSKFGISVQPKGKKDDCIVFPKTFSILKYLNCSLFKKDSESGENNSTEIVEMDVFDHDGEWNQVVCWNVNESVDLCSIISGEFCSFCATRKK
ncbi:uncharacterized protein LOC111342445 [Stylophora pistillata]|nr:uncharacterized protein LOC111342445 [Stylophora pistillata]XP_022805260.1 uncharacterized protein LOC111342445 [Stylophora pistillata]